VLSAADVQSHAAALRNRSPEHILAWGVEAFGTRLALTVSFGGPGVALAHMLHRLDERVPIVFLDTGMLFPETYEFKESFARRYGLNVLTVQPLRDPGHPLAYWTRAQVTEYLHDNDIPHHPLLDLGYTSLGCWPCTRATFAGEDERAGRWPGLAKTECGLHTFTSLSDSRHES
jgi:3'-phosphoadenosine 5'-phosphosulfate sulfotransferase (PAPS reductase)/FAD synthetase